LTTTEQGTSVASKRSFFKLRLVNIAWFEHGSYKLSGFSPELLTLRPKDPSHLKILFGLGRVSSLTRIPPATNLSTGIVGESCWF